jgi:mono/diheme cytochrome c family protein
MSTIPPTPSGHRLREDATFLQLYAQVLGALYVNFDGDAEDPQELNQACQARAAIAHCAACHGYLRLQMAEPAHR